MNKEINDLDRITIGVREWAVGEALRVRLLEGHYKIEVVLQEAANLEQFVLGGIGGRDSTQYFKETD